MANTPDAGSKPFELRDTPEECEVGQYIPEDAIGDYEWLQNEEGGFDAVVGPLKGPDNKGFSKREGRLSGEPVTLWKRKW